MLKAVCFDYVKNTRDDSPKRSWESEESYQVRLRTTTRFDKFLDAGFTDEDTLLFIISIDQIGTFNSHIEKYDLAKYIKFESDWCENINYIDDVPRMKVFVLEK